MKRRRIMALILFSFVFGVLIGAIGMGLLFRYGIFYIRKAR